jgi:hypothetical protein
MTGPDTVSDAATARRGCWPPDGAALDEMEGSILRRAATIKRTRHRLGVLRTGGLCSAAVALETRGETHSSMAARNWASVPCPPPPVDERRHG